MNGMSDRQNGSIAIVISENHTAVYRTHVSSKDRPD